MNARCLILDIGGVLELTPRTGWLARWDERLGLPPGTADRRLAEVWDAGEIGTVTEDEVREQVAARLGLGPVDTESFLADLWDEYLGTPNTELIDYVAGLRPHCRLGILSNSFVGARELESAAYDFDRLVDEIVYSHEIGVRKPDPRAFAVTCARLQVRPGDCLFVDDFAPNVEAARAAGMRAHLFEDNAGTVARIAVHLDPTASV
ncbi:HAD family phosphatase [Streptomyces sp. NBC_01261]|uniref:HAD family hydrolase n=1 Tax=Streptomyces sp. NBC_01261 TaxID=2903802 RepID=UPI002E35C8BF|nr:HAD family phosphatase [Streptomyces sp. NBC_01261]